MSNLFKDCLNDKSFHNPEKFKSFMFCRWLSGNKNLIPYANLINYYYREIPDEAQYELIQSIKNKPKFIKYIKYKLQEDNLDDIMKKYKINKQIAQEYYNILEYLKSQKEKT